MGLLNFSTVWQQSTPLGLSSAAHYAQRVSRELRAPVSGTLSVQVCGPARVTLPGRAVHLTPRQLEIVTVLALNPDGLSLDALHAHVYGDAPVSLSTLKSEVSALRGVLGGAVASRPYRLSVPVTLDLLTLEAHLLSGQVEAALSVWGGVPFAVSESPLLAYWRSYLEGALRGAVLASGRVEWLWAYTSRFDDLEALGALEACLAPQDPRGAVVRARRHALHRAG